MGEPHFRKRPLRYLAVESVIAMAFGLFVIGWLPVAFEATLRAPTEQDSPMGVVGAARVGGEAYGAQDSNDAAVMLTAVTGLVSAVGGVCGGVAAIIVALRTPRHGRPQLQRQEPDGSEPPPQ